MAQVFRHFGAVRKLVKGAGSTGEPKDRLQHRQGSRLVPVLSVSPGEMDDLVGAFPGPGILATGVRIA